MHAKVAYLAVATTGLAVLIINVALIFEYVTIKKVSCCTQCLLCPLVMHGMSCSCLVTSDPYCSSAPPPFAFPALWSGAQVMH